ncbi:MAG: 50S ribosomal protein L22 [Elusimicrobia bacterium]|jgi:large subunit ribosomal protein L22|nr:50S ribosomal protein L22 [Elusimicrobiota bacterium]
MIAKAKVKYIRMSPRKVNIVLGKIRGKKVSEAYAVLGVINKRAAVPVLKLLKSAVANGDAQDIVEKIKVKKAWVGQGPALKRLRPRAMGRADIYKRPSAHIEIEVGN